jgi:hypothetical protein
VAERSTILGRAYSQSEQLRSSIEESGEVTDTDRSRMGANSRIVKPKLGWMTKSGDSAQNPCSRHFERNRDVSSGDGHSELPRNLPPRN